MFPREKSGRCGLLSGREKDGEHVCGSKGDLRRGLKNIQSGDVGELGAVQNKSSVELRQVTTSSASMEMPSHLGLHSMETTLELWLC